MHFNVYNNCDMAKLSQKRYLADGAWSFTMIKGGLMS